MKIAIKQAVIIFMWLAVIVAYGSGCASTGRVGGYKAQGWVAVIRSADDLLGCPLGVSDKFGFMPSEAACYSDGKLPQGVTETKSITRAEYETYAARKGIK